MARARRFGEAMLDDVARHTGVHKATASRALSASGKISLATVARVRAANAELDYVSNGVARALSTRRTLTVGSIIPTLENAIYAVSTNSLERRLEQSGYVLLVACHEFNLEAETRALDAMLSRGVDGVVLVGKEHARATLERLRTSAVPHVFTWSSATGKRPTVGFDNRRTGRMDFAKNSSAGNTAGFRCTTRCAWTIPRAAASSPATCCELPWRWRR